MFGPDHYVPVLKCKQGERQALIAIDDAAKDKLTPLIELDDLPRDLESGEPNRDLERHCDLALDPFAEGWGDRTLFLDPEMIVSYRTADGKTNGAEHLYRKARGVGLAFVPVIGLRRTSEELAAADAHPERGVCVRFDDADLGSPTLDADVKKFLGERRLDPKNVDVVIDLGTVCGNPLSRVHALSLGYLKALPEIKKWRSLTVAASAFPENMAALQRSSSATFPRIEWLSWSQLHHQRGVLPRLPTFGDYGIQHPELMDGFDPRFMAVSAAIRYSLETDWLILKGQSTKRVGGTSQYPTLAKQLMGRAEFMGAKHCPGCHDVDVCSKGTSGLGSSSIWRRIGTVHHLMRTTAQISDLASA